MVSNGASYIPNCLHYYYMDGLSRALSYCKSRCYYYCSNMNHTLHGGDICVTARTAIALQLCLCPCVICIKHHKLFDIQPCEVCAHIFVVLMYTVR